MYVLLRSLITMTSTCDYYSVYILYISFLNVEYRYDTGAYNKYSGAHWPAAGGNMGKPDDVIIFKYLTSGLADHKGGGDGDDSFQQAHRYMCWLNKKDMCVSEQPFVCHTDCEISRVTEISISGFQFPSTLPGSNSAV